MAQAIPIYPFPNGFVPASGVKNSLDNGAPAAEPLEDDGAASTPKTAPKKKRKRASRRYAPAANPSPGSVAAPPVPVVPIPVVEAPSTQPESNAICELAAGGWGAMMKARERLAGGIDREGICKCTLPRVCTSFAQQTMRG